MIERDGGWTTCDVAGFSIFSPLAAKLYGPPPRDALRQKPELCSTNTGHREPCGGALLTCATTSVISPKAYKHNSGGGDPTWAPDKFGTVHDCFAATLGPINPQLLQTRVVRRCCVAASKLAQSSRKGRITGAVT